MEVDLQIRVTAEDLQASSLRMRELAYLSGQLPPDLANWSKPERGDFDPTTGRRRAFLQYENLAPKGRRATAAYSPAGAFKARMMGLLTAWCHPLGFASIISDRCVERLLQIATSEPVISTSEIAIHAGQFDQVMLYRAQGRLEDIAKGEAKIWSIIQKQPDPDQVLGFYSLLRIDAYVIEFLRSYGRFLEGKIQKRPLPKPTRLPSEIDLLEQSKGAQEGFRNLLFGTTKPKSRSTSRSRK